MLAAFISALLMVSLMNGQEIGGWYKVKWGNE
jgi:hypothetical protein